MVVAGPVPPPMARVLGAGAGVLSFFPVTVTVAEDRSDAALAFVARPVSVTSSPLAAREPTLTLACSSSVWPTGTVPRLQLAPVADGQTVNFGDPT